MSVTESLLGVLGDVGPGEGAVHGHEDVLPRPGADGAYLSIYLSIYLSMRERDREIEREREIYLSTYLSIYIHIHIYIYIYICRAAAARNLAAPGHAVLGEEAHAVLRTINKIYYIKIA